MFQSYYHRFDLDDVEFVDTSPVKLKQNTHIPLFEFRILNDRFESHLYTQSRCHDTLAAQTDFNEGICMVFWEISNNRKRDRN